MQRFVVTWCAGVPVDEFGDSQFDQADDRIAWCGTKEEADLLAREKAASAVFGYAEVQAVQSCTYAEAMAEEDRGVFKRDGKWWVEVGDAEEVDA